ncbi:alpha/beta hydrolase family protein [Roseateles depolymerans]|uniref:alpha/beta hydrolase family protein n=1 Tax=Roseateles depolymerans TaxID=76731 RepID=UPI00073D5DE5|nr:prolyl oligopeptidase family serine peptidase [Roseateles depolymerans]
MKRFIQGLMLALCVSQAPSFAQEPVARIPAEKFFQPAEMNEVLLSPSGRYLALTTTKIAGRRALYVFDLNPGGKPTQAARFEGLDVVGVQWVNENRLLFNVTDLSLGSGSNYREPPGLYAVDRDGGNLREIVRRTFTSSETSSKVRDRSLAPNHMLLRVPPAREGASNEEVIIGELRLNAAYEATAIRPLIVNVNTGQSRRMPDLAAPASTAEWLFDSANEPRIAVSVDEMDAKILYREPGQAQWRQIGAGNLLAMPFTPRFFDASGRLYVTERIGAGGVSVLKRFDFKTGAPEDKPLISTGKFDFQGEPVLSPAGELLGVRLTTDAEDTIWFNPQMKAFQEKTDKQFPGHVNRISCRQCGQPDMVALVRSFSDRDPGQVVVYRAKEDAWQSVGPVVRGIDPAQMPRVDFQYYKARDGMEIPVWVTLPPGVKPGTKPAKPLPTVVYVHGGPNARGRPWGWAWSPFPYPEFMASRGYVVLEPEFRGSDGFGQTFLEAGFKQWGQAMQNDLTDVLQWAQKQGLSSDKACIAGASYGGYATLAGLMVTPDQYRCGIAWVAVSDLMLLAQGSSWIETDVSALSRKAVLSKRLGDPVQDEAMLRQFSPVLHADKMKAPLLLAMGAADVRVPLAHGERMRDALVKAGNPPEWVVYPGEGHTWLLPESHIDFAKRMERFLAKHLDGQ